MNGCQIALDQDGYSLLVGAAKRLSAAGGDPVVELQTNFGGGKTHSMLALYHMAGGTPVANLPGLDQLLSRNGLTVPNKINRAVLVGTSRGPQDLLTVKGGLKIKTTWGELAWQLGGAEAFAMIAENDERGIAPGSNLLEAVFKKCAPCLILIDEWVAYLRQIYRIEGLPSGTFDANLTFVQSLTEAVKASPGTLLVASLPASQIEVGGEGGQEALEARQLDNMKEAMRSVLAWDGIVKDTERLNLTQRDSALAKAKAAEASGTVKTRLKETWCYLLYPMQVSAQADIEWVSSKIPAQDGLLSRASKKLASDEGLLPELGPARLDRELQKYIWNGKDHLFLKDLWEYLNRYTYLPRVKNRGVLTKAVQSAVGGMMPGPFAFADRWDEAKQTYVGLAISGASHVQVVIDSDSIIIKPDVAEAHRPKPTEEPIGPGGAGPTDPVGPTPDPGGDTGGEPAPDPEKKPTRFVGTVMISADRPARDMHQIVEAVIEQLTTLPGSEVSLKLEIDAEVSSGLDRAKVRTLIENATTLGFIDKAIK